jgi:hypothetical protein
MLKNWSVTGHSRSRAAGCEIVDQRRADFRLPVAAVVQQKEHQLAHRLQLDTVDQAPAVTFAGNQAGAAQDGEMRGHGVVRHVQPAGNLACRQAVRLLLHKQPEDIQPGRLRQRGQGVEGILAFHVSRHIDIVCDDQMTIPFPVRASFPAPMQRGNALGDVVRAGMAARGSLASPKSWAGNTRR